MKKTATERFFSLIEKSIARIPWVYRFLKSCKVRYQRLKYLLFHKSGEGVGAMYNEDFFDRNLEWNIPIVASLVNSIIDFFHPHSVVDVGCGNAEFLSEFKKRGVRIKGYEGSQHALDRLQVDPAFVSHHDLRQPISVPEKHDLAMCLEVAEHIAEEHSATLIKNIASLSDAVLFTAAHPGQGGHFHINEQPSSFWGSLFESKGFFLDKPCSEAMIQSMKKENLLYWYYENFRVFKKR